MVWYNWSNEAISMFGFMDMIWMGAMTEQWVTAMVGTLENTKLIPEYIKIAVTPQDGPLVHSWYQWGTIEVQSD